MILNNFPFLNKDEVKKIIANNNQIEELRKPDHVSYDKSKCTRENRINNLKSNIFNDPGKCKTNREIQINLSRDISHDYDNNVNLDPVALRRNQNKQKSMWESKLDWKAQNTEILFKKENNQEEEEL